MNLPSLIIQSQRPTLSGWRYFWAKRVTGFNASRHCATCLKGTYLTEVGLDTPVNETVALHQLSPGDVVYICGVASPYRWANNAHLAVRITGKDEDVAGIKLFNGDALTVSGAAAIPFGADVAARDFGDRPPSYRTCRNFQFGAQMVAEGVL